ncbi:GntR family transcriptional regulator [Candidatus Fermentibacteria bacterium]|nr:MAG: GntR family transcriptional regulator [Candidatus Fermentibacteria bacterium]
MLRISSESALPVYQQLKRQIRRGIASGEYPRGHRLPSIRELAAELTVNPNTIAKVYRQLEADGFLVSKQGSGFFVAESQENIENTRKELLEQLTEEFVAEAIELGINLDRIRETVLNRLEGSASDDNS